MCLALITHHHSTALYCSGSHLETMERLRLDYYDVHNLDIPLRVLEHNPDVEWDEAFQVFWIEARSPTRTWIELRYPNILSKCQPKCLD